MRRSCTGGKGRLPRMTERPARRCGPPGGAFHVTDMSREQMEAAGYGFHHESEDGKARTSPPCKRGSRNWVTYEAEQEMASGMVVLPGRGQQTPV